MPCVFVVYIYRLRTCWFVQKSQNTHHAYSGYQGMDDWSDLNKHCVMWVLSVPHLTHINKRTTWYLISQNISHLETVGYAATGNHGLSETIIINKAKPLNRSGITPRTIRFFPVEWQIAFAVLNTQRTILEMCRTKPYAVSCHYYGMSHQGQAAVRKKISKHPGRYRVKSGILYIYNSDQVVNEIIQLLVVQTM